MRSSALETTRPIPPPRIFAVAARTDAAAVRVGVAGAAVVAVAFGMGRFAFGLTLPDLRADPGLSADGLSDPLLGLIASATFAGFLVGIVGAPMLARRLGPRAPTTLGCACGAAGGLMVLVAQHPGTLAPGAVLVGSAAGWVWAPYNDLVAAVAPPARRPGLLALISTGTSAGLVVVALVAVAGPGWRTVWAAVGLASAASAVLNLRWTPRVAPVPRRRITVAWKPPFFPAAYAVGYYVTTTLFFTYAAETLRRGGLPPGAGPALYAVIGVVGLAGLLTGRWCERIGARRVAASCLGLLAVALMILGLASDSWAAALAAAVVFGPGYMAGAAVIAIWTSSLEPENSTEAMTGVITVGALAAVVGPAVVGLLVDSFGLPAVLSVLAVLAAAGATALAARRV
jgi:predicted MFS family arabinose efflux permease